MRIVSVVCELQLEVAVDPECDSVADAKADAEAKAKALIEAVERIGWVLGDTTGVGLKLARLRPMLLTDDYQVEEVFS